MNKRFRIRQEFWLNVSKPDELELAEMIDGLKQGRVYSQAIRDGLRLVVDLWRGNLDMLLALFPWVEEAFYQRFVELQPPPDYALQDQLANLERLLIEQGSRPVGAVAATNGAPKAMAVPSVPAPAFDDFDDFKLEIKQAKSDGLAAQNFLNSALSLQG